MIGTYTLGMSGDVSIIEQALQLVEEGYDRCAERYARHRGEVPGVLGTLISMLPAEAQVLDVGCGSGKPVGAFLACRCRVTGVDLSAEQIRYARRNVPAGDFIKGDILAQTFEKDSFDAVVCLYAIFHLPSHMHYKLFQRVAEWIKPGGLFFVSVAEVAEETTGEFWGVPMYWSSLSRHEYERLLQDTGFEIVKDGVLGHGYLGSHPEENHPYFLARRMGS